MRKVFLILLATLIFGCTTTVSVKPTSVEPPKELQVTKIPYNLSTEIDEKEVIKDYDAKQDVIYEFHTGSILKDAVKYYVYPYFDASSKENIHFKIRTAAMQARKTPGETAFSLGYHSVQATISTAFYKNNLLLYTFSSEGFSKEKFQFPLDYSLHDAARNAIVEAVKKIPQEVSNVLSNPEGALMKQREAIKAKPDSYLDYFSLAHLSLLAKKYDDALAAAKRTIELDPKDGATYVLLGDIKKELKNYPQAIENYKKAIAINPNYYAWYERLSHIYNLQENYSEIITLWQKAVSVNPNLTTYYQLASAYTKVGKYNDAITNLNKAIELATITGIGTSIAIEENYPVVKEVIESSPAKIAGIEVGDKIVEINGQSTKGWDVNKVTQNLRGAERTQVKLTIERGNKEFEKVITMEKIIKKEAASLFGFRSQIYAAMGNFENSFKDAEMAYSINPNDNKTKTAMSLAYIQKGKPAEALKILASSNENFDKLLLAIAYAKNGEIEKAATVYKDIPEDYLASKSVFRNDFKKMALQSMKPYIEGKRKQVEALEAKGQYKEVLKEYGNLIKFLNEQETKELRVHIAKLLKEKPYLFELPEDARKFAIRAEEFTKEGKFEEAVNEYKKALSIAPFHPELYKALALNYGGAKQYKKAIDNMKIYLELYPDAPDARAAKDEIYRWEVQIEKEGK